MSSRRALVEGLFGVRPDALAGVLEVAPGFPEAWEHARLRHPRVGVAFARTGDVDRYRVETRFPAAQALRVTLPARRDRVASVTIDGRPARFRALADAASGPRIAIEVRPRRRTRSPSPGPARAIAPAIPEPTLVTADTGDVRLVGRTADRRCLGPDRPPRILQRSRDADLRERVP